MHDHTPSVEHWQARREKLEAEVLEWGKQLARASALPETDPHRLDLITQTHNGLRKTTAKLDRVTSAIEEGAS